MQRKKAAVLALVNHTNLCIEYLKNFTDTILISYSGGKDSIAILDILSKHFKCVCFFLYIHPDLEYNKNQLEYPLKKYGIEVLKYPHRDLFQLYSSNEYRLWSEETDRIINIELSDIYNKIRNDTGIQWVANGMKQCDSMTRRAFIHQYYKEAINLKTKTFYPLSKWNQKQVKQYIKINRLLSPVQLNQGKQSEGIGIDKKSILFLYENYPNDYKLLETKFPLIGALIERERKQKQISEIHN